jgi:PAS domain S-box-containing protein
MNERSGSSNDRDVLHASEQQLRAANQQLQANEQQLRAHEQQLRAANQQLRAANQQLQASEQQLREAQQMAHLGYWSWDTKTGDVEWSEEVYRIFQLHPKEFTPQIDSILALSPWPEDHQRDKELMQRAIESHQQGAYEQRFLYPDGSTGYYYSTFQGIYDGQGNLTAIRGTVQDITERRRAEEAVVDLSKFPSENPSPVLRVGAGGEITYHNAVSACLAQSWGCEVGSFLPTSKKAVVEAVLDTGEPKEIEEECGDRVFALTFAPIRDAGYVNIYGLDITQRKRADEALTERVRQMNVLNDLMKRTSSSLSLDQVAQLALDGITKLVDADMSLLFTRDEDQLVLRAERWRIPEMRGADTPVHMVGQCLCGVAVSEKRAVYSLDIREDPRCIWRECKEAGPMSLAALPLRSGEGIVGVLAVGSVAECDFSRQATFLEAMSHGIAASIRNAFLYEQLKDRATKLEREIAERIRAEETLLVHQRKLRSLASELSLAEERERRRIATGLHDHACQTLVLSRMKLQGLGQSLPPDSLDEITGICHTLDKTNEDVRRLIFDLSSPTLYRFGLEPALEELLEDKLRTEHGIRCTFCDDGAAKPLAEDVRILLFQSVRELLINIVKHAQAHEVSLDIVRQDDSVRIAIRDDGVGFDVEEVLSASSRSRGFGLFNIKERLDYIGGSLDMDSRSGQGSRFTLVACLEADRRDHSDVSRGSRTP